MKESCKVLNSKYKQLLLTLELAGKSEPVNPLPNQCRNFKFSIFKKVSGWIPNNWILDEFTTPTW